MLDPIDKINAYEAETMNSKRFSDGQKYIIRISADAISCIRMLSFYSTRASHIYENVMTIRSSDDLLQSIIGIQSLTLSGIQNMAKREIRYLLEMAVKYAVVDQALPAANIQVKAEYLKNSIPNSSIDIVDNLITPFGVKFDSEFKSEIKDKFSKACAYVHPSKEQLEEQLMHYSKGENIGFETAKMVDDLGKILFQSYDIILALQFISFGHSMTGDVFIHGLDDLDKWKFHKGKYVKLISEQYNSQRSRV